jgi:hypothetical protein
MNTKSVFSPSEIAPAAIGTVAQPLSQTPSNTITVLTTTGTVGHAGTVAYSRSAATMVNETNVIANKK